MTELLPLRVQHLETKEIHEAYQITEKNLKTVAAWCAGDISNDPIRNKNVVVVPTRIYPIRAFPGDYVVKRDRPKGPEFFLKDAKMFELFFEEVDDA